uniref:Tail sheath protein n=1 Tax=Siphoviridae sp. ctvok7 TaxID=2827596 RepID=A0A8S5LLV1_9CAUD|nr:MAG TPA: tail sheath protein [Siphoviridae sp. ctvok7]
MAGGTWNGTQNKIRPGVYIDFTSSRGLGLTVSDRGTVAIAEAMSWGPVETVQEIEAGSDMTPYTGYDITNSKNRFLNEIFKGTNRTATPNKVLLYRLGASGQEQATVEVAPLTVTAKYPGSRGNDISIVITELTTPADTFTVSTVVGGEIVDQQTAKTVENLVANDWVTFSGTGALAATAGTALTGGADGTPASADYTDFLTAIEPYKFDVLIYDGSDTTVQDAMVAFVKRLADEEGMYTQLVAAGLTNPDSRFVVNVQSGVTLNDGTALTPQQVTWWAGGALAGAQYNESLTYATYPNAVDVSPKLTNSGYEQALTSGQFVLWADDGVVKVEQDINSLVTYTTDITEPYHKNRVMRLVNTIANDIYQQFSDGYIGVVNNNEAGRMQFKSAIVGYLLTIQANEGIQNFEADDVTVEAGEDIDAIVVTIGIQPVDSVEKIYVTISVN